MRCSPESNSLRSVISNSLLAGCPNIILNPISVNGFTKCPHVKSIPSIISPFDFLILQRKRKIARKTNFRIIPLVIQFLHGTRLSLRNQSRRFRLTQQGIHHMPYNGQRKQQTNKISGFHGIFRIKFHIVIGRYRPFTSDSSCPRCCFPSGCRQPTCIHCGSP